MTYSTSITHWKIEILLFWMKVKIRWLVIRLPLNLSSEYSFGPTFGAPIEMSNHLIKNPMLEQVLVVYSWELTFSPAGPISPRSNHQTRCCCLPCNHRSTWTFEEIWTSGGNRLLSTYCWEFPFLKLWRPAYSLLRIRVNTFESSHTVERHLILLCFLS